MADVAGLRLATVEAGAGVAVAAVQRRWRLAVLDAGLARLVAEEAVGADPVGAGLAGVVDGLDRAASRQHGADQRERGPRD
jgi:hypothetical protein